jgi:hypothetical protein
MSENGNGSPPDDPHPPTELTVEKALDFVDELVRQQTGKRINYLQRRIFEGAWQRQSYRLIHKAIEREFPGQWQLSTVERDVAPKLWDLLTEVLGESVSKMRLREPITAKFKAQASSSSDFAALANHVDGSTNSPPDSIFNFLSDSEDDAPPDPPPDSIFNFLSDSEDAAPSWALPSNVHQDWGTHVLDVSRFYGRNRELDQLEQKIRLDNARLIALSGIGKIGKTALAFKLGLRVRDQFDFLICRSLYPPMLLPDLVQDLVQFFSRGQETSRDLGRLLHYLFNHRCLILLDGFESLLQSGVHDGSYQPGYAEYGNFLTQLGRMAHQSCIILTSREIPKEVVEMEGETSYVNACRLKGMGETAAQQLLGERGIADAELHWRELFNLCGGSPFVLQTLATRILNLAEGSAERFLAHHSRGLIRDICELFDRHLERLSPIEKCIIDYLTTHPEPAAFPELQIGVTSDDPDHLEDAIMSLLRRSLVESNASHYSLNKLVKIYFSH